MLTPKTPLDVAELVTIKSVSLSNSHIPRTEKLSTKAILKVSVDGGSLLNARGRGSREKHLKELLRQEAVGVFTAIHWRFILPGRACYIGVELLPWLINS